MTDSSMPSEWHKTTLGAVAQWSSGGTPSRKNPEYYGGDVPWVKTGDLGPKVLSAASEYITELGVQKSSAKYFPKGSVAIAMYGATIGKTSILGFDATTNQACAVGQPVDGITDTTFLYYLLRNEKNAFIAKGKGGAQPNISQALIKDHEIALPPLAEQKIIADKLDILLAQVETTKTRLERITQILKRFRQSVLAAAVSGRLTEGFRGTANLPGWREGELGGFIEKPRYGSSAKSQKSGVVPVLRMGNLQGGKLDWGDLVYTSDPQEIEKYRLEPGDVLFNRTNSPELVGKTSIFRGEREAIYAGYLIKIKGLSSLNPEFLNYQLNSPKAKDYCKAVKSDGVSQSNINAKKLAAYPLSCPPLEEQTQIVHRVNQLFAHADRIEQQVQAALERVNHFTQSILAKAFRGELTEQWRRGNPELISGENSAEALLERIEAERAAMKPAKRTRKSKTDA